MKRAWGMSTNFAVALFLALLLLHTRGISTHELADDDEDDVVPDTAGKAASVDVQKDGNVAPSPTPYKRDVGDDLLDDEEFDLSPPDPSPIHGFGATVKQKARPQQHTGQPPIEEFATQHEGPPKKKKLEDYPLEVAAITVFLVYVAMMFRGKRNNEDRAVAWHMSAVPAIEQQFSQCGMDDAALVMEGYDNYKFFATGRVNCQYLYANLEFQRRQDVVSQYLIQLIWPKQDVCELEILLDHVDPLVFCVCRKKELKALQGRSPDLNRFAKVRTKALPSSLAVLSDSAEVADVLLGPQALKTLAALEQYVQLIHVSDQMADPPSCLTVNGNSKKCLRFHIRLPSSTDKMDEIVPLVKLCLHLIDAVSTLRLSEKAKQQVTEGRRAAQLEQFREDEAERQEKLQQRKAERKRKEDEDFESLTAEQQRRKEGKNYKKQLKNQMPKFKVMKV